MEIVARSGVGRFALLITVGSLTTAIGFLVCGSVVARFLLRYPPPPPGFIYMDPPLDGAESKTTRPIWLPAIVVGTLLSLTATLLVRRKVGVWAATFGLCNPLTFLLGSLIFIESPWHGLAPGPYQLPLHPLTLVFASIMVLTTALLNRKRGSMSEPTR